MSGHVTDKHLEIAGKLVEQAHAADGLAPVDLGRFWADQAASQANPFGPDIPQVPLGACCNWECVFEEMGVGQQWKRWREDAEWRRGLSKAYNDRAGRIVGRRLLGETPPDPNAPPGYPAIKSLPNIFEMETRWDDVSQSDWWMEVTGSEDELAALLDRVDKRLDNLREFLLPDSWDEARQRLMAAGHKPPLYRGQRGPVTFAAAVTGPENLIFLIYDNPDLAVRFRDTILRAMLEKARIQDEEAGYTPQDAPHGFSFCDDNCCLLTADMYELFGLPIVNGLWDRYSPDPADTRYQHSDSDMGHIVPVLARCDLTGVNFGPNVMVGDIRPHMPRAVVHGCLAPFTYSRNEEANIVAEFLRDFEAAREQRGLVFATAGSINNGSRLTGMRLIMSAIQTYGRYDS